jgi:hypothetical protein
MRMKTNKNSLSNHSNQDLARQRTEERLHAIKKQKLIKTAPSISKKSATRLSTLRDKTIESAVNHQANSGTQHPVFTATHYMSDQPNFRGLRHDLEEKRRVIVLKGQEEHNVNPAVLQVTPVKKCKTKPHYFISPGKTLYQKSSSSIKLQDNGVDTEILQPLERVKTNQSSPKITSGTQNKRLKQVNLSYNNLVSPLGRDKSYDNRRAHQGHSAHELAAQQLDEFEEGLITLGLANPQELLDFKNNFEKIEHEHTHMIAGHFGILKNDQNQIIDPRHADSTFIADKAINSEMMLFEKFVDFLLFINHKRIGYARSQASVNYRCEVTFLPNTTQALQIDLQVTDFHTNKTFKQTLVPPQLSAKPRPSAQMYTTLLKLLKASLSGQNLASPDKMKLC